MTTAKAFRARATSGHNFPEGTIVYLMEGTESPSDARYSVNPGDTARFAPAMENGRYVRQWLYDSEVTPVAVSGSGSLILKGDVLAVESPIYRVGEYVYTLSPYNLVLGDTVVVVSGVPDSDGDVKVRRLGETDSSWISPDALLHVKDLPRLTEERAPKEESFSVGDRVALKESYEDCPPGTVCTVTKVDDSVTGYPLLTVQTEATGREFGAFARRFDRLPVEPAPAPSASEDLKVGDLVIYTGTGPAPGFPEIASGRVGKVLLLGYSLARVDFGPGMARVVVRREHLRALTVGETVTSPAAARLRGSVVRGLRDDVTRKERKIRDLTAKVKTLEEERADVARRTAIHARRTRRALDALAAVTAPTTEAEDLPF